MLAVVSSIHLCASTFREKFRYFWAPPATGPWRASHEPLARWLMLAMFEHLAPSRAGYVPVVTLPTWRVLVGYPCSLAAAPASEASACASIQARRSPSR